LIPQRFGKRWYKWHTSDLEYPMKFAATGPAVDDHRRLAAVELENANAGLAR
jgi:hypothetical protein